MPSKRFDDMSRHDPPGRIQWRINLETGEIEQVPGYDPEAEQEFACRRMYPDAYQEDPLQERPEPPK